MLAALTALHAQLPMPADVTIQDFKMTAADGADRLLRWCCGDGPAPVTDCYAGLQWLAAEADKPGVDPVRLVAN